MLEARSKEEFLRTFQTRHEFILSRIKLVSSLCRLLCHLLTPAAQSVEQSAGTTVQLRTSFRKTPSRSSCVAVCRAPVLALTPTYAHYLLPRQFSLGICGHKVKLSAPLMGSCFEWPLFPLRPHSAVKSTLSDLRGSSTPPSTSTTTTTRARRFRLWFTANAVPSMRGFYRRRRESPSGPAAFVSSADV